MVLKHRVEPSQDGKTVKHIAKSALQLSERLIKRLKYGGKILKNSLPVPVHTVVHTGDLVEVHIDFVEECEHMQPQNIPIDIVFEDEALIVLNKPPHIVVHPTSGHPDGTIANALAYHMQQQGAAKKIRPVSRLDRDTSGIILFAKNEFIQAALIRQMQEKVFHKEYFGIVHGVVPQERGSICLPIARKPGSIMLRHVSASGSPAVTHYEVLDFFSDATLVKFSLETGRTHQIRVHCQAIGHPLIGDTLYPSEGCSPAGSRPPEPREYPFRTAEGHTAAEEYPPASVTCPPLFKPGQLPENSLPVIDRQALHSHSVRFIHPFSGEAVHITVPIPADMQSVLEILRK